MKKANVYENGKRKAVIMERNSYAILPKKYNYIVYFYYDGYPDYEWKRGSDGLHCDICETLKQAKRKARYYINKYQ